MRPPAAKRDGESMTGSRGDGPLGGQREHDTRLMRAAAVGGIAFAAALAVIALMVILRQLLAVVLLGVVLGTTLGPLVDRLAQYRIPRPASGLLVYGIFAAAITGFFWYAVPELVTEGEELGGAWDDFERDYNRLAEDYELPDADAIVDFVQERLAGVGPELVSGAVAVIGGLFYTLTILAVGLFWTMSRRSARGLFVSLVPPEQREKTRAVLDILGHRLRRFLVGELLGMLAVGTLTFIGLVILDVRFALILATLAFLLEILPFLGPWLAYAPAAVVAITQGWETFIAVSVLYLVIQQLESYVIVPVVQGRETKLPELLILVSVLIGAALMGILGALVAIPVAVIGHTLFMEVFVPWRQSRLGGPELVGEAVGEAETALDPAVTREQR